MVGGVSSSPETEAGNLPVPFDRHRKQAAPRFTRTHWPSYVSTESSNTSRVTPAPASMSRLSSPAW